MKLKNKLFRLTSLLLIFIIFELIARFLLFYPPFFNHIMTDNNSSWRLLWTKRKAKEPEIYYSFDLFNSKRGWVTLPTCEKSISI